MKKILMTAALVASLTAVAESIDGVAARVDSHAILKSEVYEEMRRVGADASRYEDVRNDLIDRQLVLKCAQDMKMTMQDWIVDNRVREIVNHSFNGDRNRLMENLSRQKISYQDWRQRIQEDMIVAAMRWQMIGRQVEAGPVEMREEYKNHPERYSTGRRVTVSVILLRPEDAERRDEVSNAIMDSPFADVAKKYSADSHAAEGGVWKDIDPESVFRAEVCEEISKMPTGTLSRWIEMDGWSFLIRKDADDESKLRAFAEAYDDIADNVRNDKAEALYRDWIRRLRDASYIKVY